jgi:tetratricopeptide (TPR) repeat protein
MAVRRDGGAWWQGACYDLAMRPLVLAAALLIAASSASGQEAARPIDAVRALLGAGKSDEALATLRQLVREEPGNAAAHNMLGSLLNSSGHYAEALPHAEKAVELDPANGRYRYNRGVVRAEHGRFAEAVADFDAALAAHPDLTYAWLERGAAKLSLGDLPAARADWQMAAKTDPKLIWPHWYEATGDFIAGDFARAAAGFDRVAAAEAGFDAAKLWSTIARGRTGIATQAAAPGGSGWPAPVVRFLRGELDEEGLLKEAATDRISGDQRRTAEAHFFIAQKALIAGDQPKARSHLRLALAIPSPRHVWRIAAERDLRLL